MTSPSLYETLSPAEAVAMQHSMRKLIDIRPYKGDIKLIGGADISFNKYEEVVYAGIIVLKYPDMIPVARSTVITKTIFPYISGLLAFREVPALMLAWQELALKPDVMVLDGQGIAHERRLGIATHFGLLTDIPSLGCAKSRLAGTYTEPANAVFAETALMDKDEHIGVALRTKKNCNPVYISPGHHVGMVQSVNIIKSCVRQYRIPEPTRLAHILVNEARINAKGGRPGELF